MQTVWKLQPGAPANAFSVNGFIVTADGLFYSGDVGIGSVDKKSGHLLWQHPLSHTSTNRFSNDNDQWGMTMNGPGILAYESYGSWSTPARIHSCRICCVESISGKSVWEIILPAAPRCPPAVAGSLLLLVCEDGLTRAIRLTNGSLLWEKRVTSSSSIPPNEIDAKVFVTGDIGIVRIGERLGAFRTADGAALWSDPAKGADATNAEKSGECPICVVDGVLYSVRDNFRLVAWDARSGRTIWERTVPEGAYGWDPICPVGNNIISSFSNSLTCVRRIDGKTVWFRDPDGMDLRSYQSFPGSPLRVLQSPRNQDVYGVSQSHPLIDKKQRKLRSVGDLDTLICLDAKAGCENWRWQPDEGYGIQLVWAEGDNLYTNDGRYIRREAPGTPNRMPLNRDERRNLARRIVGVLFNWANPNKGFFERIAEKLPHYLRGSGPDMSEEYPSFTNRAALDLVRLGKDSIPALVEFVRAEIHKNEGLVPQISQYGMTVPSPELETACSLIVDVADASISQNLARELDLAKNKATRMVLARTLVRLGEPAALASLLRYARNPPDEATVRADVIYYLRGAVPAGSSSRTCESPNAQEVHRFLRSAVSDRSNPHWLRCAIGMELKKDGQDASIDVSNAARQSHSPFKLMPIDATLSISQSRTPRIIYSQASFPDAQPAFPTNAEAQAIARDPSGRWWAAFECDYFGDRSDLWFAQSVDKKKWTKPAFGLNLQNLCSSDGYVDKITLRVTGTSLVVDWVEQVSRPGRGRSHEVRHRQDIPKATFYRDTDGDGIPDLAEARLGLDPRDPDANGNGLTDGFDGNPSYRLHEQSDGEGIYCAVLQALCEMGRTRTGKKGDPANTFLPYGIGNGSVPLVVPAYPGCSGIALLGHTAPVISAKVDPSGIYAWPVINGMWSNFKQPVLGFDGRPWQERAAGTDARPTDPFVAQTKSKLSRDEQFREYFPYERKGNRVRIAWQQLREGGASQSTSYDIEARKIGGQWVPVECRLTNIGRRFVYIHQGSDEGDCAVPIDRSKGH